MSAGWPGIGERDAEAESEMEMLIDLIRGVRNLRTESGVPASARLPLTVVPADAATRDGIERGLDYLAGLARVGPIDLRAPGDDRDRPELVASTAGAAAWLGGEPAEAPTGPPARPPMRRSCAAGSNGCRSSWPVTSPSAPPPTWSSASGCGSPIWRRSSPADGG